MAKPPQRALQKEASRRRLLAASRALFLSRGYPNVEVREIARAVGMSTGVIYNHFGSKAELWRAAMGVREPIPTEFAQRIAALTRDAQRDPDPAVRLATLAEIETESEDFIRAWGGMS